MASTRFPNLPSNLPPESVSWGRDGVESLINELLSRVAVLESQVQSLGGRR